MSNLSDMFVGEDCTIGDAIKIIDKTEKKTVFVVRDYNKLVGVVNDGDVRRSLLQGNDLSSPVTSIMNDNPITDVNTAKDRLKLVDVSYILVPIVDGNNRIIDCTVVTDSDEVSINEKDMKRHRRVLVIGGAGYLGSVLCEKLLHNGYNVRVLDVLLYGDDGIKHLYKDPSFEFIKGDARDLQTLVKCVHDVDAVIHLAAIVGDPASSISPEDTIQTNYFASKMIAEVCKYSQINRFIFASTCSVYGANKPGKTLVESSMLNPVSLYAKMKLKSEGAILDMTDDRFKPTVFRMATLHGVSPRMRFDLVVNLFAITAIYKKMITVNGGEQYRSFCHVDDAAQAYINCLEKPIDKTDTIFNIVSENLSIGELGNKIKSVFKCKIKINPVEDIRDYKVSSIWANSTLELSYGKTIDDTLQEIKEMSELYKDYTNPIYSNVEWLS